MYTLSFINQKGGVGKTTLTMNLAARLGMTGVKVLLVDMDPQCSLSYLVAGHRPNKTILDVIQGKMTSQEALIHTEYGDLLAASPSLALLDRVLTGKDKSQRLRQALEPLKERYQFALIDSPPALGLLMLNVLGAVDSVVIPAAADMFSLQAIGQLGSTIRAVRQQSNPHLAIDGILLSQCQGQMDPGLEKLLKEAASAMDTQLFDTQIPHSALVPQAQIKRQSVFQYAPDTAETAAFNYFTLEYLTRLRRRMGR